MRSHEFYLWLLAIDLSFEEIVFSREKNLVDRNDITARDPRDNYRRMVNLLIPGFASINSSYT